ncbi:MAG: MFS transporter [Anaerolineales bacterium]
MNFKLSGRSIGQTFATYANRVGAFQRNARLYLINVMLAGAAFGVFRLLFNFYVLSLGYDESLLGQLITTNNLSALIVALPIGYLADRIGRKRSLLISGLVTSFSVLMMVIWPSVGLFYVMNVLLGMAQSLGAVTTAPFLMENSGEEERTYLFSFSFGLQTLAGFIGNWLGGYLPMWMGLWQGAEATSSVAYGWALGAVSVLAMVGLGPLFGLRRMYKGGEKEAGAMFAPLAYFWQERSILGKLILPLLMTALGAGMVMPFMNVFFRVVHHQSDGVIGALFAWGSLAMGIGMLIAPPLAERYGKIQVVVVTQALSIPFLIVLGYSPWFWLSAGAYYVRLALMNMSNPVYQTFVMEHVDPESRATVASLTSMAWNFGWAFSPSVSGMLQVESGFGLPFLITIVCYIIAVGLYWQYFWRKHPQAVPVAGD